MDARPRESHFHCPACGGELAVEMGLKISAACHLRLCDLCGATRPAKATLNVLPVG